MRFGVAMASYGEGATGSAVAEFLSAAEELNFDSVWFADHIAVPDYATAVNLSPTFLEPLATIAWGLARTSRLRFGTDVLVAPYRHPLHVAAIAGTLGRLAGDRLILGVGVGYLRGEFDALGVGPYEDRGRLTDEFLQTARSPGEGLNVVQPPTPVPLWVGGNGAAARRRAALRGDGWHPLWMPADQYVKGRQEILDLRASAGLTGGFTFSFSCGRTRVLDRDPGDWPAPTPRAPQGSEFRYAPAPWTDEDNRPRLVGTPEQFVGDLRLLEAAGVDHVMLRFGNAAIDQLELFAREVAPAFGKVDR
jgi:alkanesulfonate monooxygenase SsuD/methylene tetrahydromethanopterin reductase-like flavin-dependent oxidoreductase (luciferase family)